VKPLYNTKVGVPRLLLLPHVWQPY